MKRISLKIGLGLLLFLQACGQKKAEVSEIASGPVTYSRHIAPILLNECATCHRPGQAGPFELLTFEDARAHAKDIARVTAKRIMPPWLPEIGHGEFVGERRLSQQQIDLIQRWVQEGMAEGNPADVPPRPQWPDAWQLGQPSLVMDLEEFPLAAEGKDIYFSFVEPIPITSNRFVSAVELLPGNRAAHHAFIKIDETRNSRRLAAKNNPPGFFGMDSPETAGMPGGQLLGWQPGKIPQLAPPGLAWVLKTNTDLVLQLHMNPTGKPEMVKPRIGFYFTDTPPTNTAYRLRLATFKLDIPPGDSNYVAETSYTTPVDLQMVRVGAHAHYLCKEMQGYATLPNGEKKWLLFIKDWDFKWQGDYQYKEPVFVPKGSKVTMRFTYDNSVNNPRNPNSPPKRTLWGLNSNDEMGELYFQTLPRNREDFVTLARDFSRHIDQISADYYRFLVEVNPADGEARQRLGRALFRFGQMDDATTHLLEAIRLNPGNDKAYFDLGSIFLRQGRARDSYNCFKNVTLLNPEDSQAYGSLGIICMQINRPEEAREHFMSALRINPEDTIAIEYLRRLGGNR